MRISIEQLTEHGYKFTSNEDYVEFYPVENIDKALHGNLIDIAQRLGFNKAETDQYLGMTYRLQVISVIRRCSGW